MLLKIILGVVLFTQAHALSIPNELGEPKAGGLPRESSPAYELLYGSVRIGQELQRVIVTLPPGEGPKPALFFIGGLGCYSLDFSGTGPKAEAYQRILDFATRQGFVTMRVEKTGMGDSVGTRCEYQDFRREVAGNLEGLKALASFPFVDSKQIHIFGHSIGGVIAPLLAAKVPVKGIAVLGSLATDWYDYDLANNRRQSLLSGMSPAAVESFMYYQQQASYEFYRLKKPLEQILVERPDLKNYLYMPAHWTYMQQLTEAHPVTDWNLSRSKVVIFSGAADFIGSQEHELQVMVQEVNKTRATPLRLISVEKLDHFFRNAESQSASLRNQQSNGFGLVFQETFLTLLKTEFLSPTEK